MCCYNDLLFSTLNSYIALFSRLSSIIVILLLPTPPPPLPPPLPYPLLLYPSTSPPLIISSASPPHHSLPLPSSSLLPSSSPSPPPLPSPSSSLLSVIYMCVSFLVFKMIMVTRSAQEYWAKLLLVFLFLL